MPVARTMLGQYIFECQKEVVRNGRVGVFVDGDRCRGVGAIHGDLAVSNAGLTDNITHLAGDINHLVPASRTNAKIFLGDSHNYSILHLLDNVNS
jgi:hypothetical protein